MTSSLRWTLQASMSMKSSTHCFFARMAGCYAIRFLLDGRQKLRDPVFGNPSPSQCSIDSLASNFSVPQSIFFRDECIIVVGIGVHGCIILATTTKVLFGSKTANASVNGIMSRRYRKRNGRLFALFGYLRGFPMITASIFFFSCSEDRNICIQQKYSRDLNPGNLLVNANCDLKICDFGVARTNSSKVQFMTEYALAIDLLQKMLIFDPTKRISVTEALEHPYMSPLYDPRANPPAQVPIDLNIDENISSEMIREMMWQEMLHYHPEVVTAISMS